jgi:hypothetical protein
MKVLQIFFLIVFSLFSSFVMSYIALATVIGPWMGPTLILLGLIITSALRRFSPHDMLLPVIGGSLGGIIATCVSFSFPTYYFIDKDFFMEWASRPASFITLVAILCMAGGFFALWIVSIVQKNLLKDQKLPFPVGKLVYDVAVSSDSSGSKKQLLVGVLGTVMYSIINTALQLKTVCYAGSLYLLRSVRIGMLSIPTIKLDMSLFPMFVSIGFIAGHLMTVPLLVGAVAHFALVDVIRSMWFLHIPEADFMLAFCSGIVVVGAALSLIETPKKLWKFLTTTQHGSVSTFSLKQFVSGSVVFALIVCVGVFSYFKFSVPAQLYALVLTALFTYQMVVIAGKIGMALLGRFATFIMVPGMFIFSFTGMQATVIATFVELCGGVASELLFGRKTAELADLDEKQVTHAQVIGIIVGSCAVAVAFWFLITHFQLGSEQLFAQRAQGRALTIQAGSFDVSVLAIGACFGIALYLLKINSMLVLGGLLMSLSMIIPLVLGGALSLYVNKKERFEPLCSGIYATNSIWMILGALLAK